MKNFFIISLLFFINIAFSQLLGNAIHITSSSTNLNTNEWSYIVITKGSNNDGNFYKNGQLIYSGTWQNLPYSWSKIELGAVFFTSYSQFFSGNIDEVRYSNIVRTSSEIFNHYNNNLPFVNDINTIGLWHLEEADTSSIIGSSGQNGIGFNASSSTGKVGNSVLFNGINSRIQINQSLPTSNITLEFWIKPNNVSPSWPVSLYGINTSGFGISLNSCTPPPAPTGTVTQTFCATPAPTVASLTATGTGIQWYAAATGGTALSTTTSLVNGTTYYASQTVSGCESTTRLAVTVTVNPNIAPTFTQVTPICAGATLAALPTTSNNGYTGTWSPAMNNTATTTYTFTPTAGLCATTATMTITVNPLPLPPTGAITQTFCANIYPTLQNIVVTPANVNWFSSLTSSTPLPITTNLPVGSTTYYASQFDAVTGCSSNGRLAVLATVLLENTPSTLTDQTFCSTDLKTLADIKTNGLNIVWYSSASGGTPLLGGYVLTSSQNLYAAIYNATTGCESPIRQMVQITIINCQLVANNLLTLNDNSLNDNLKIENIENFPINQIEIYNRFGEIVWKTEYYNNDSNTFKGRANVSGVYQKDSDLPTGTYYFLLKYFDSYRGKYTDLKSFLYINNNN